MLSTDDHTRSTPPRSAFVPVVAALAVLAASGCGGEGGASGGAGPAEAAGSAPSASATGEVRGPIDASLAARGEELFRERGCAACHRLEGRLVGPAMSRVTARRDFDWFRHMVVNPDSMIRSDSTARAMLAEYMVPMPDQGVTDGEARALFEYFRREDAAAGAPPSRPAVDGRPAAGGGSGQ